MTGGGFKAVVGRNALRSASSLDGGRARALPGVCQEEGGEAWLRKRALARSGLMRGGDGLILRRGLDAAICAA